MSTAIALFNLFCLVYGSFMTLYYFVKILQRGRGNILFALLAWVALTWGIYSVIGIS